MEDDKDTIVTTITNIKNHITIASSVFFELKRLVFSI